MSNPVVLGIYCRYSAGSCLRVAYAWAASSQTTWPAGPLAALPLT